jgi:hypothetical protein
MSQKINKVFSYGSHPGLILYTVHMKCAGHTSSSTVSEGKGLYQLACQEKWKKCKEEEE